MKIITLEQIDSTHTYLRNKIQEEGFSYPICITTQLQTQGIGSRGNHWEGKKGNLFFSFVVHKNDLPNDLPLQSASIYFSFILKMVLAKQGSKLWLKWPNDFYIDEKKIGGTITTVTKELIYCGIGLNAVDACENYGKLDIVIDSSLILKCYFETLQKADSWKQIFSQYKIEFHRSQNYKATINNRKISLQNAQLNEDGSIEIDNTRIFSLR